MEDGASDLIQASSFFLQPKESSSLVCEGMTKPLLRQDYFLSQQGRS
jgi:hypothetical protein